MPSPPPSGDAMEQGETGSARAPSQAHRGLTAAEAASRLLRDGPNALDARRRRAPLRAIASVAGEPMLLLLAAAAGLYAWLGEWLDATAMLASVAFVVLLNIYQNLRAERALDALRELTAPRARVLRDGVQAVVAAETLVVGDLLLVAQGDRITADARVLEGAGIEVDESLLTGESVPVPKSANDAALRAGTFVVQGEGIAEVTATGAGTEFGRLGDSLASVRRAESPLRQQIRRLVGIFAPISLAGAAVLAGIVIARGADWRDGALAALTFALATVPEEFPVILSVMFALGAWRLARIHALVQRPDAIETLGCMSVLCTDKTGTLTENRMRVERVLVPGAGFAHGIPDGDARSRVLDAAAYASPDRAIDPMDLAVIDAAGADPSASRLARFYPFSNDLHATAGGVLDAGIPRLYCKGAPEALAELCGLDSVQRDALDRDIATLAASGYRVLGVGRSDALPSPGFPDDLRGVRFAWCGLLALVDPLRADVPAAVQRAQVAGVRVLLVTGDHPVTARAIAQAAGIATNDTVISGSEIAAMRDDELVRRTRECAVYARVRPADKLRLVQCLVAAGDVVGMTGDGINDAPALAAAHVGIAMGGRGSDVARHAASVVLADDRFSTIVDAVALGRAIYANLLRAVQYVTAVHIPIAGAALLPAIAGVAPVLLPVHVVLLELLIDPASTLVFERRAPDPSAMRVPPRPLRASLLTWAIARRALALGIAALFGALATYALARRAGADTAALPGYLFISVVSGNLAALAATAWPAARGRDGFTGIAIAALATSLLVVAAAVTPLPARLLHLGHLQPSFALVAALLPAGVVAAVAMLAWPRRGG
jgi:Ca2+-transporting ATPase